MMKAFVIHRYGKSVALQAAGVERIKAQLREIHDAMAARDIPAGGQRAQRLFA